MSDGSRPESRRGPNRDSRCFRGRTFCGALILLWVLFSFAAARGQNAAALIAKGDQFDEQLKEKEALQCYLPANRLAPDNVDLLVRIARQYRHLMSDTTSKKEKLRLGNVSLQFAQRAAALAPNDAEAQLSPAISYGKMLPYMTSKDQVCLLYTSPSPRDGLLSRMPSSA